MKKHLALLAIIISGIAIVLAVDPGRFAFDYVDVGGHQLRMLISGRGSPTVVFETGGSGANGGPLEGWERVQPTVSEFTKTVSYDRAGIGFSEPGPKPRDARQIARELHIALRNAHAPPPYVLVGHSFGGPFIRVFADMYPGEISGMILIDPTTEEFVAWEQTHDANKHERYDEEWKDIQASLTEAHESRVPDGIPIILITAMGPRVLPGFVTEKQKEELKTFRPVWLKFHQEWLGTVPNAQHVITENSGHGVPFEEPELVIKVIRQTIKQAMSHQGPTPVR